MADKQTDVKVTIEPKVDLGNFEKELLAVIDKAGARAQKALNDISKEEKKQEESQEKNQEKDQKEEKKTDNTADAAEEKGSSVQKVMQKLGSTYLEVGKMAISSAASVESAMDSYILSTGKSADETEAYQGVLENIYSHNYGESFDEIASAMAQVTNTMGDMGTEDLESLTESAFALKDAFGVDIVDSTAAAKTIMDEFKVSGEEAMNLIAAGAMDSKGNTDQLMEGIAQYSEQFSQLGVGAEEMFALFASGAETGSYSFEELGGAVSEMASRITEGSEETREGLESMGLNADEIIAKFQEGGESAGEAFEQTMEALESMEDPLEQS